MSEHYDPAAVAEIGRIAFRPGHCEVCGDEGHQAVAFYVGAKCKATACEPFARELGLPALFQAWIRIYRTSPDDVPRLPYK